MKEEKMAMRIGLSHNPSLAVEQHPNRNTGGTHFSLFDFENPFQSLLPAHLLVSTLAVIVSPSFITNGTVGNEMVKSLTYFGVI